MVRNPSLAVTVISSLAWIAAACSGPSTSDDAAHDASALDAVVDATQPNDTASTDATTTDTSTPPGEFPGPTNTGVPAGTTLTDYTGPCTISVDNTVIDAQHVRCDLSIQAANVTITRSHIDGIIALDTDRAGSSSWSFTLQDSEVSAGMQQLAAVSDGNSTIIRANIHGGETAVHCGEHASTCVVRDSWLHGQLIPADANWHLGGFLSNGGTNVELTHNTIVCDAPANPLGEGCTGDLNLIPVFAAISHVTIEHNLLGANVGSAYCTYGGENSTSPYPHADHVVYTNNVFERGTNGRCADYGPVTGFDVNGTGNVWTNNTWDDGTPVAPEN